MNKVDLARDIRSLIDKLVDQNMTYDELIAHPGVVKGWQPDTDYAVDDITRVLNVLYKCEEAHHSADTFDAEKFKILSASSTDIIPDWVMPTTSSGGYYVGDVVMHNGQVWISSVSSNYEEPGKGTNWTLR